MAEDFNLRHLRAVAAVVRLGSVSAAAREIGLSQPAVTQALARTEERVGTRCFHRMKDGMAPTDAGLLAAARAEAAHAAIANGFCEACGRDGASPEAQLTTAQLRAFLALAEAGSYSGAARALEIAQPTLHRAVADLQKLCAAPLLRRQGRGIALTEGGSSLARAFRLAVAEIDALRDEIAVLSGKDQGSIRIGVPPDGPLALLARVVAAFHLKHPPVSIRIEEDASGTLVEALREGWLDIVVAPASTSEKDGLDARPLGRDAWVVVGAKDHPLAEVEESGAARMATFPWIVDREGSHQRAAWERLFLDQGLYPPEPRIVASSPFAAAMLPAGGECLTLLRASAAHAPSQGDLVRIRHRGGAPEKIEAIHRFRWSPTPAQAAFLDEVEEAFAEIDTALD